MNIAISCHTRTAITDFFAINVMGFLGLELDPEAYQYAYGGFSMPQTIGLCSMKGPTLQ